MNAGTNVSVRGEWPGLVTLRSGWWKAVARPLNDDSTEAVLRAERSTVDFVRRSADALVDLGVSGVHSPPLMRGMDRTYRAAGFEPHAELLLLERDLRSGVEPQDGVHVATAADREAAVSIDANAFVGDWRVGRLGLEDALTATPNSTMLALDDGKGFAIVGVSTEIGVSPENRSRARHAGHGDGPDPSPRLDGLGQTTRRPYHDAQHAVGQREGHTDVPVRILHRAPHPPHDPSVPLMIRPFFVSAPGIVRSPCCGRHSDDSRRPLRRGPDGPGGPGGPGGSWFIRSLRPARLECHFRSLTDTASRSDSAAMTIIEQWLATDESLSRPVLIRFPRAGGDSRATSPVPRLCTGGGRS
jgi:hypothetical protein